MAVRRSGTRCQCGFIWPHAVGARSRRIEAAGQVPARTGTARHGQPVAAVACRSARWIGVRNARSEEPTSELQSLMRISYAVFCLKKKKARNEQTTIHNLTETHNNTAVLAHHTTRLIT